MGSHSTVAVKLADLLETSRSVRLKSVRLKEDLEILADQLTSEVRRVHQFTLEVARTSQAIIAGSRAGIQANIRATISAAAASGDTALLNALTPRETEVLKLIGEGKRTKEIAFLLGISVKTAITHRTHVMEKLNIHEGPSLVRFAIRSGLCKA